MVDANPYPLPELKTVLEWSKSAETASTELERKAAKACLVVAFARAKARAEGVDETQAVHDALDATRERRATLPTVELGEVR